LQGLLGKLLRYTFSTKRIRKFVLSGIFPSLLSFYPLTVLGGAYYIVPPYIDDLNQSVKSPQVQVLKQKNVRKYGETFSVNLNGSTVSVRYACTYWIPKIKCRMGTHTIYASVISFLAVERNPTKGTYETTSPTTIDIKVKDSGDSFKVCGMMGTERGNALLTDHNDNSGTTEDSGNPSWLAVEIKEVCK